MVGERNKNVFLIHIDTSNFAEFELSEFEISRVDCITMTFKNVVSDLTLGTSRQRILSKIKVTMAFVSKISSDQ